MSLITQLDCLEILKNIDGSPELQCYKLQPLGEEVRGFLGEYYLLTLTIKDTSGTRDVTLFVKSLQTSGLGEIYAESEVFKKELFMYQFCDAAKKSLPSISVDFLPQLKHHTNNEVLVLNNLTEEGYKDGKFVFDTEHMHKALDSLAKLHAVSIAFEEHKTNELGRKYEVIETYGEFPEPVFPKNKESLVYKCQKSSLTGCLALIDIIIEDKEDAAKFKASFIKYWKKIYKLLNDNNDYKKVISHGDLWGHNTMFKYANDKPVHCVLIDFQLVRYVPPAFDVTTLIYFSTERSSFIKNVHKYFNYYYEALTTELSNLNLDISTILSLEEFNKTCKLYMPVAKLIWLIYRQVSAAQKLTMADINLDSDISKSVMLADKRPWFIKVNYQHDPQYRTHLRTLLQENRFVMLNEHFCVEDCYKIITSTIGTKDYDLLDIKMQPVVEKGGFLGEHHTLTLQIKTERKQVLHYFVKLAPTDTTRLQLFNSGAEYKEAQFYGKILPDFKRCGLKFITEVIPECYLVDDGVLVLDNLKQLGYQCADKRKSMSLKCFQSGLRGMAKLHAAGIIYEDKFGKGLKLNEMYSEEFQEAFHANKMSLDFIEAAKKGLAKQIELFSNHTSTITPEQLLIFSKRIINDYKNLIKPSKKFRNTICHGDLWANNIMFLKEDDPHFIDFQTYRYCPPAHDVIKYLHLSTDKEFRTKYTTEVLDYYHSQLKDILERNGCDVNSVISKADFLLSCEEEKMFAVAQAVTHKQNFFMSNDRMDEIFADTDYSYQLFYVDRSHNIEHTSHIDPVYKKINEESIADLRELIELYVEMGRIK